MFYHVLIELKDIDTKNKLDKEYYDFDYSFEDILNKIYIPFLQNKPIKIIGYRFNSNEIKRLMITKTSDNASKSCANANAKIPIGVIVVLSKRDVVFNTNLNATDEVEKEAEKRINLMNNATKESKDEFELTNASIGTFENVKSQYESAYIKVLKGTDDRNAIDDLRRCMEDLLRVMLNNKESFEVNIKSIKANLDSFTGGQREIKLMINQVFYFYVEYQNENAKHGNNVAHDDVLFLFELSGAMIRYISRTVN